MKEDYLWDKTGTDPEIEKLENALKAFRQKDETPPEFPARIIPVKSESPRRRNFQFAFAFAAGITFILVLVGVWFQIASENSQPNNDFAKSSPQKEINGESTAKNQIIFDDKQIDLPTENPKIPAKTFKRETKNNRKVFQKISYRRKRVSSKIKTKNIQPETETVKLTKEEKFAYNQLMLALSITSEKLNLVRDKVRGEEKEELSIKNKIQNRSN